MPTLDFFDDWGVIQQQYALDGFMAHARQSPYLAVDTEFRRENTYFAELALIQVATDTAVACIDPLAGLNLDTLIDLLSSDQPTLLHSVYQDAEILFTTLGCRLTHVLDTQIAAAFSGESLQLSYRHAVEIAIGQHLDKGASRSDWMQRPLSGAQQQYAKLDVTYLADIRDHFFAQLDDRQQAWAWQESDRQVAEAIQLAPEAAVINRIKLHYPIASDATRRLVKLHQWREQLAIDRNKPRRWIVGDQTLVNIALDTSADEWALETMLAEDKQARLDLAPAIASTLAQADQSDRDYSYINPISNANTKSLIQSINGHCQQIAQSLGISAGLLASKKMIVAWIHDQPTPLTEGWRGELLGDFLTSLRDNTNDANNAD